MTNLSETLAVDAAFAMIDVAKWGARASIVALTRLTADEDGVAYLSRREVATFLGLKQHRYVRTLLAELVAARVLLRVAGAGTRPHAYRLNPEVGEWEVPWREGISRELAVLRVALLAHSSRPWRASKPRLVARTATAPQADLVARTASAPLKNLVARTTGAPLADPLWRATGAPLAAPEGAPYTLSSPKERDLSLQRDETPLRLILQAIAAKGGYLRGRGLEELRALLATGLDPGLAIPAIEAREWPEPIGLRVVDWLAANAATLEADERRRIEEIADVAARAEERRRQDEEAALERRHREEAGAEARRRLEESPELLAERLARLKGALVVTPNGQNGSNGKGGEHA